MERQVWKKVDHIGWSVDAMRVEAEARPTDRNGEEKRATRLKHPLQLGRGLPSALGVERVAVPTQTDVFGHMEAGQRLDGPVR